MTESYSAPVVPTTYAPPVPPEMYEDDSPDTKDVAKDQAAQVGQGAVEAGQHIAGVAKEQAGQVTAEAGKQAKDLLAQAQVQLKEQAGVQQERLVSGLKSLRDELSAMVEKSESPGVATDLARQAADRTGSVASWLDGREPAAVLDDVTSFARRKPGAFLAIAAGIGLVAGRLTRGLAADAKNSDEAATPAAGATPSTTASTTATTTPTAFGGGAPIPPAVTAPLPGPAGIR